jgi:putative PIN family toxin of toxin-antitoxin system
MAIPVVIDTNVFVSAMRSGGGASRQIIRRALDGVYRPLFSNALWLEYEDLLGRPIWTDATWTAATTPVERRQVMAALAASGEWVNIWFGWRPNLPDEADNYLFELAVAGGARAVITHNVRDLRRGELVWDDMLILTPAECLEKL